MIYLDTSAFLKTVWQEPESAALTTALRRAETVSSAVLSVEARRGALRIGAHFLPRTDLLLREVTLVELSTSLLEAAGRLPDPMLRSLDAVHVATAMLIRDDLDVLISYDQRMLAAAAAHGLPTASPA